ncbi:MAG: hypothetical protein ACI9ZT_000827 [Gammaproteobacteria bacterium]|jgi:hypothetical protein
MNLIKKLSVLIVFIIFTACGQQYRPSEPTRLGLIELKKLCEKDAGVTVYETIEADGYYDDTTQCLQCFDGLLDTPSQYIEFCADGTKNSSSYILKEPGCYRLTKIARDTNQCHAGIDERYANFVAEPYASFKQDNCIKVEPIERPSPGVGLFIRRDERTLAGKKFDISRYEYTIKSTNSNQKYGQYIGYSLQVYTVNGAQHKCGPKYYTDDGKPLIRPSLYKYFIRKIIQD